MGAVLGGVTARPDVNAPFPQQRDSPEPVLGGVAARPDVQAPFVVPQRDNVRRPGAAVAPGLLGKGFGRWGVIT